MREDFPTMKEQVIRLAGLRSTGTHGVLPSEHEIPQEFVVDVDMVVCTEQAVAEDSLHSTVSYADVADIVLRTIQGAHVNLIETLADRIAEQVAQLGARKVTVTVHKPQAPLEQTFSDVSTTATVPGALLTPRRRRVVIGIGSNLDVPEAHIIEAVHTISHIVEIEEVSELYLTEPQLADGQQDQPDYVNAVITCYTDIPPLPFLHLLHHIEAEHGRIRTKRWEARTLDIDVIDVEGLTSVDPELLIPHPRAAQRRFVLEPWFSIDPTATLAGVSVAQLLEQTSGQRTTRMDAEEYMPRVMEVLSEWEAEDDDSDFLDDLEGFDDFDGLGGFNGWGDFSGRDSDSGDDDSGFDGDVDGWYPFGSGHGGGGGRGGHRR
ncbi:MAG: 2-amino-4-hydroxy-6-hydroxymethyldihydropteridine diphosphokinase [Actinomycetaceae bacterium]|nr:2-amino-4-hydroxy-6-hydroxymethyldihydropteridine diphosphokinase [Actinomycetaceae bacterium]MDY5854170.1 2-amino-4-hydroxy-6-hydroxymethyldihydropteridine diphosphokinase [Arcanobacterium sp.]